MMGIMLRGLRNDPIFDSLRRKKSLFSPGAFSRTSLTTPNGIIAAQLLLKLLICAFRTALNANVYPSLSFHAKYNSVAIVSVHV